MTGTRVYVSYGVHSRNQCAYSLMILERVKQHILISGVAGFRTQGSEPGASFADLQIDVNCRQVRRSLYGLTSDRYLSDAT